MATAVDIGEPIAGVPTLSSTVYRVVEDAADTYTFWSTIDDPDARRAFSFAPGQISMVGIFGVGEVPISISSDPARPMHLAHTIRACGRVTNVFAGLRPGDRITIRAPFGRPWPVERGARRGPADRRRRTRPGAAALGRVRRVPPSRDVPPDRARDRRT